MFPLTGDATPFQFDISYFVEENVTIDGISEIDTLDTTLITNFIVNLTDEAPNTVPDSLNAKYWERSLGFYSGVDQLSEVRTNCELRFIEEAIDILYSYSDVSVTVHSLLKGDSETFTLNKSGNTFQQSVTFDHESSLSIGDGTVQVELTDTLIARFENPKLPLDTIEIRVPFDVGTLLTITSATYYDNSGNGFVDSIFVGFDTEKSVPDSDIEELFSHMNIAPERNFSYNKKSWDGGLALNVTENNTVPRTGIESFDTVSLRSEILSMGAITFDSKVIVTDSVAPVILANGAFLNDEVGTVDDRLTVLFSETIKDGSETGYYFNFYRGTDSYTAQLTAESIIENSVTYSLGTVSIGYMNDGDSLRINSVAKLVEDKAAIVQMNENNPLRVLSVQSSIAVTGSAFYDSNADGLIDSVTVSLSGGEGADINIDELKGNIVLPSHRNLRVDSAKIDGLVVTLFVTQTDGNSNTAVTDQDSIKVLAGSVGSVIIPANISTLPEDKMSPVIMESGVSVLDLPGVAVDTVTVLFSESIVENSGSSEPFEFRRGVDNYSVFLSLIETNGAEAKYVVDSVAGGELILNGDSLRISSFGLVEDLFANVQINDENIEREVAVVSIIELSNTTYYDATGDGFIDSITIDVEIEDGIIFSGDSLLELIDLPSFRLFTIISTEIKTVSDQPLLSVIVTENRLSPNTAVTDQDSIVITKGKVGTVQIISTKTIPVIDRVAPVILENGAILYGFSNDVDDTLSITFSESVTELLSSGEQFSFRRGNTPYNLLLTPVETVNNEIVFSVDTITSLEYAVTGDSLRINSLLSQITDLVGNRQNNVLNIERELTVISKVIPQETAYFDNDANGMIDQIEITLDASNAFFENSSTEFLTAITLSEERQFSIDSSYFEPGVLVLSVTEGSSEPNTAVEAADIVSFSAGTVGGGTLITDYTLDVVDSMAPVIMPNGAILYEFSNGVDDTLSITFSESVTELFNSGEQFSIRHENTPYTLFLTPIETVNNEIVFSVDTITSVEYSVTGDSLRINALLSEITDLVGNRQNNVLNIERELKVISKVIPQEATYFDNDANGMIDQIEIALDASNAFFENSSTEFLTAITLSEERVFSIDSSYFEPGVLVLSVTEGSSEPNTAVEVADIVRFSEGTAGGGTFITDYTLEVIDSMAPVIMPNGAMYHDSLGGTDLVDILFSEPVIVSSSVGESIRFYDGEEPYQMFLKMISEEGNRCTFTVEEGIRPESEELDSVQINSDFLGLIQDLNGLAQVSPENIRRSLQVKNYVSPYELQVGVLSPYVQGVSPVPAGFENVAFQLRTGTDGGYTGMAMQVRAVIAGTNTTLVGPHLEGRVRIFDHLGNQVLESGELVFLPESGSSIFVWNGLNEYGREVASGAYLAHFIVRATVPAAEYELPSGEYDQVLEKDVMIGVKKPL